MFQRRLIVPAISMAVAAQVSAQALEEMTVEVVVVTAERVEKSILDVSTTTNVLNSEFIERENLRELNQIANFIPNMLIQEQAVGGQSFTIRGIGNEDGEQKLGSFFNGLNVTDRNFSGQFLHDIERVEVLKGPQPTAFGSFAVNGAVNVVSKKANLEKFEASVGAGYGSFNEVRFEGMINVPVTDWLALRFAGFSADRDGYSENLSGEDLNARLGTNLRFTASAEYERFSGDFIVAYEDNDGPGIGFNSQYYREDGGVAGPSSPVDFGPTDTTIDRQISIYQLKTAFQVTDNISINYNGYYNDGELYEYFDADGAPIQLDERDYNYNSEFKGHELFLRWDSDRISAFVGYNDLENTSQYPNYTLYTDFRYFVARDVADALFVAPTGYADLSDDRTYPGNYPLQDLRQQTAQYTLNNPATINPLTGDPVLGGLDTLVEFSFPEAVNDTTGFFASVDFQVTDDLTLNLGVRDEETEFNGNPDDSAEPLWKVGANYSLTDEFSLYYTYAEGRTPPLNTIVISDVERETVFSHDVGFYWVTGQFQLQAAYFNFDYENLVVQVTDSQTGLGTTANAEATNVSGFELQGDYTFNEMLGAYASFGSNDAKYGATTDEGFVADYAGNNFRYSPEFTYSLGARFTWEDLYAVLSYTYMDDVYFEPSNDPDSRQEAYGLLNLSVEYKLTDKIRLGLYGKNILDESYLIDAGNFGGNDGQPTLIEGTPASWVGTINYAF
ncbi:TonB-dependent receptor [Congregibacter sp.]|uniref:TonB-dependent receptor n=1 Tax=Congregibacter sp. TaxID=2744308 RepID=UPI003F6CA2A2